MIEAIKADLFRVCPRKYSLKNLIISLRVPGFRYMFFFRKTSKAIKYTPFWFFYKFILTRLSYKYGFQIPLNTKIANGFYIGHFGHVILSPEAVIGENCNIGPGVTVGKVHQGNKKGAPIIGNQVWIGTNSVIVGKIVIGSNVLVAPGSFVNFDVPDNSIVIGNPSKIIEKINPTEGYINNLYFSK